jgi:hypothetical protein
VMIYELDGFVWDVGIVGIKHNSVRSFANRIGKQRMIDGQCGEADDPDKDR